MCLTGVDYFSTLGYQPGIAFLAAGLLSPLATLVLVLLTLFGALPMYRRVAELSPHGQGSIAILEDLLPRWRGKALVLCLLGFAATGFIITITLSAADAAAHIIENPMAPEWLKHAVPVTLVLLTALGAIFLIGFREAVGLAVPLVAGDPADSAAHPAGRIRNAKKLLSVAALIMSVLLVGSSIVTTMLVPEPAFKEGGEAYGRALAYLAHKDLGETFGTVYDLSTVTILWFAGASAMVGLLCLVPKYLPRYGMAPEWAKANRPLVVIFTLVTFLVTMLFEADVNTQGGAYATGVLVLMGSAALAVTLDARRSRRPYVGYLLLTAIFLYTTAINIWEKPEGIKIASIFIVSIVLTSLISRVMRSTELRVHGVDADERARQFLKDAASKPVRIIANRPDLGDVAEYEHKLREARDSHHLPPDERQLFIEVRPGDVSAFSDRLAVTGVEVGPHRILRTTSPAIPNAIAALLLYIRDETGKIPHAYFGWTEGNPIAYLMKFLAFGEGDTAPVTREVLRQTEPDPGRRPRIHVG